MGLARQLLFASPSRVARLPTHPNVRPLVVSQALAKRWSLPLTLLKGELAGRLLSALATGAITPGLSCSPTGTLDAHC